MLTADVFAEMRYEMPDGGRWTELVAGEILSFEPPEEPHSHAVMNVAKALARWNADRPDRGVAVCSDLGLLIHREPDTVRFPSLSIFVGDGVFDHLDDVVTSAIPQLVVDVVTTNDRRRHLAERIQDFLRHLVPMVWIVDPAGEAVHVFSRAQKDSYTSNTPLPTPFALADWEMVVDDVLRVPEW